MSLNRIERLSPPYPSGKPYGMDVLRHASRRSPSCLARRSIADLRLLRTIHRKSTAGVGGRYVHDSMAGFISMGMNEYASNGIGIAKFRTVFKGND